MRREKLVRYLDDYLDIHAVPDSSKNGLQVEGRARVERVAVAVDACLQTIRAAARHDAGMLIVHHGLFWRRHQQITGVMQRRIAALIEGGVSLYAAHLPLDCHGEVGNNVELARIFGLKQGRKFGEYNGVYIGYLAEPDTPISRRELVKRVERGLKSPAQVLPFGPDRVRRIGIISGGAAEFAADAKELGCDAFVTGETSHTAYHLAKESRINLVYAGHYASETVGVRALGRHLKNRFGIAYRFLSAPTGY